MITRQASAATTNTKKQGNGSRLSLHLFLSGASNRRGRNLRLPRSLFRALPMAATSLTTNWASAFIAKPANGASGAALQVRAEVWQFRRLDRRMGGSSCTRKSIRERGQTCSRFQSSRMQSLLWCYRLRRIRTKGSFLRTDIGSPTLSNDESGLSEIYVIPFPPSSRGGKWLVSRGGGVQPRWRRNGKELFYISPDSKMMAVEVNTSRSSWLAHRYLCSKPTWRTPEFAPAR